MHLTAHGDKVIVAANGNGALRTDFDARITFPACIRLLIVSLHLLLVQDHQVIGADVHAGSFVATLAAVTFRRIYVTWHSLTSSLGLNFPNSDLAKFALTLSKTTCLFSRHTSKRSITRIFSSLYTKLKNRSFTITLGVYNFSPDKSQEKNLVYRLPQA
jgi:hypothetical protein